MIQRPLFSDIQQIAYGFYSAVDSDQVQNPILMNQVHSATAVIVDTCPDYPLSADALVTRTVGLNLTVKTADCAPLLMIDPKACVIAAVHAGWKGAFQGIIEASVLKMISLGAHTADIRAIVGPHLQKQSFEVSPDMQKLFPVTDAAFFETENGHLLFDFNAYVLSRLANAGVVQVDSILTDTYTDLDYYSYRRDPNNPKRQYASIMLTES